MKSYVIELGSKSGEGKFEQWDSSGFFVGIDDLSRDVVSSEKKRAFHFPTREIAERMQGNYQGLRSARVVEDDAAPSTHAFRISHAHVD